MASPLNGSNYTVASANANTELVPAGTRCTQFSIVNESTATLYVLLTPGTASATNYSVALVPSAATVHQTYTSPRGLTEVGQINGFWSAQNGNARVTVLTW